MSEPTTPASPLSTRVVQGAFIACLAIAGSLLAIALIIAASSRHPTSSHPDAADAPVSKTADCPCGFNACHVKGGACKPGGRHCYAETNSGPNRCTCHDKVGRTRK